MVLHQSIALVTFLLARSKPHITSSLTAFALAPGVLNTAMPRSVHLGIGILFTPAPARAIARRDSGISISCIAALLTIIASGDCVLSSIVYFASSNFDKPTFEILLRVLTVNIICFPPQI